MMKYLSLYIFLVIITVIFSCKKDDDSIPDVRVNETIYVNNPSNSQLNAVGGWVYLNGAGARGIIIYRKSPEQFAAYDRNCTYEPSKACATVSVDSTNVFASDNCCGSKFNIIDGSVVSAPATRPLKQYQTSFDGTVLRIYN